MEEVVAAIPYSPETGKFLVLKRSSKKEVFPGVWEFPAGYIEDEEPRDAAVRELYEETGLRGEVIRSGDPHLVESEYGDFHVHPFLVVLEREEVELTEEHSRSEWVSMEELDSRETVKGFQKDLEAVGVMDE